MPFDPATLQAGRTPELYKSNAAGQWDPVPGASFGADSVTAEVSSFSWVLVNGLLRSDPVREWEFGLYRGNGSAAETLGGASQVGGSLEQVVDFGPGLVEIDIIGLTQTFPFNGKSRGYVFGTPSGVTYGVYAEAPFGSVARNEPVGGITRLQQTQNFIKMSGDAKLSFTLTAASISVAEAGFVRVDAAERISTELYFEVEAFTNSRMLFHTAGGATLAGAKTTFTPDVWNYRFSSTPLWNREKDFDLRVFSGLVDPRFAPCDVTRVDLELKGPRTYTIDLSALAIGEEFTLRSTTFAKADNRRGGGAPGDCEASAANAYLRDPLKAGGTEISFTG
ncbi:MAG: hypothetical protein Q7T55_25340, partial [Solirubrobacteraceae bacterium]|nr:hypothetical protein [Solirubrobacteraceae bacterium]